MRLHLEPAPWTTKTPSPRLAEAATIFASGGWRHAAEEFYAVCLAAAHHGQAKPKGLQRFLNDELDRAFMSAGWTGVDGRFRKGSTWLRFSFRHKMSLQSDFLDALKLSKKESVEEVALIAATTEFLKLISPNEANTLCSYEGYRICAHDLDGCIDMPMFIGRIEPISPLPREVLDYLMKPRPRDSRSRR